MLLNSKKQARRVLCLASLALTALTGVSGNEMCTAIMSAKTMQWNRLYGGDICLEWDWNWEWIPQEAASVRVTVSGMRNKTVLDEEFARQDPSAVHIQIGEITKETEDLYTATLSFRDDGGNEVISRSAGLYALASGVGQSRICVQAPTHAEWRQVSGTVLLPYDATWQSETLLATAGVLTVTSAGLAATEQSFDRSSGFLMAKGRGETVLSLSFENHEATPMIATLDWLVPGLFLFVR